MENVLGILNKKYELILKLNKEISSIYTLIYKEESTKREKIYPSNEFGSYQNYLEECIYKYALINSDKDKTKYYYDKVLKSLEKDNIYSFTCDFFLNKEIRNKRFSYLKENDDIYLFVEDLTKYKLDTFLETIKKTHIPSILFELKNDDINYHAIFVSNELANIFKKDSDTLLKEIKKHHPYDYLRSNDFAQISNTIIGNERNEYSTSFIVTIYDIHFKIDLTYIQIAKKLFLYVVFNDMTSVYELQELNTELALTLEQNKNLEKENITDALTGLGNEGLYKKTVADLNERIKKGFKDYAFLVCDVNGIKVTNDTYGHKYGCHLIVSAGKTFPNYFKTSHMFHLGGDEFVILVEGEDFRKIDQILPRLRNILEYQYTELDNIKLRLSVAIGYSRFTEGDKEYHDTFSRADKDMYDKKIAIKTKHNIPMR